MGDADEGVSGEAAARLALERLGEVDTVIATWRDACADKDRTLQHLEEELVAKSEHLARQEAMRDEESARAQVSVGWVLQDCRTLQTQTFGWTSAHCGLAGHSQRGRFFLVSSI